MDVTILLFVSILFAVMNNLFFHGFKNRGLRGMGDILFFNALISTVWIVILFLLNRGTLISLQAWSWGAIYGGVTAAFLLCKMQALATGPVSITSFTGCSSLLISTAFGVLYFKESVSPVQMMGVVLLLFSLFLTLANPKQKSNDMKKGSKTWYIWCFLFFVCSGATGIIFKLHQSSSSRSEVNQMMLAAAITSAVLFLISSMIVQKKTDKTFPRIKSPAFIYVIACGIVSCGYNRLNISLSGMLPSIVFFPVFNGSVILFASVLAAIIFHEKITKRQMLGIAVGTLALIMAAGVIGI